MNEALLELRDVEVRYGGHIRALRGASLVVNQGEIVALLGANGAGKTTTLRTISGLSHPAHGEITFAGDAITRAPSHEIVALGISQVPEGRRIFPQMSVMENLEMGAVLGEEDLQGGSRARTQPVSHPLGTAQADGRHPVRR